MKLTKDLLGYYEDSYGEIVITDVWHLRIDSTKNIRTISFPDRINKKIVKEISASFWAKDWQSLKEILIPKGIYNHIGYYCFDRKIEFKEC